MQVVTFDHGLKKAVEESFLRSRDHENSVYMYEATVHNVPSWYVDVHKHIYPFVSTAPHGSIALTEIQSTFYHSDDEESLSDGDMEF